ncbi:M55 family metallopeptidase [Desulfobotulus sp. H1]|uniref:M55 family metallopeptidase n=1 Tax=Desulfobotulus pelophilus TaxID=2823377 RepID=A0ABT3N568_9BACT|nr:M55 family metallopeptidase [Desulfobotulus pelophilus]MCW7752595.1 M55 family metallopeptidase [Desulfobotulus pelophilus]
MKPTPKSALILADIEGITGVYEKKQCKPLTAEWQEARNLITADVSAAIAGLKDAGVEIIHIRDMHATGFNILPRLLPEKGIRLQQGHHWYPVPLLGHIPEADLALMIGWHGAPDQPEAFSPHIFHRDIDWVRLEKKPVSEVEIMAAVLAEARIPVALVTADFPACQRIKENIPWIRTVTIPKKKTSTKKTADIQRNIRENARTAAENFQSFPCCRKGPWFLESSIRGKIQEGYFPSAREVLGTLLRQSVFKGIPAPAIPAILQGYRYMGCWQNLWN